MPSATSISSAIRSSGAFIAHKSGHALNNRCCARRSPSGAALETVVFERAEEAPAGIARPSAQPT